MGAVVIRGVDAAFEPVTYGQIAWDSGGAVTLHPRPGHAALLQRIRRMALLTPSGDRIAPEDPGWGQALPFGLSGSRLWAEPAGPKKRTKALAAADLTAGGALVPSPHSHGTVQILLPSQAATNLREWALANLDPADIIELEDAPHITVRFGFDPTVRMEDVVSLVTAPPGESLTAPFYVLVSGLGVFEGVEDGTRDVLVAHVTNGSDTLRILHDRLAALPHQEEDFQYTPHVSIAFTEAGAGEALLDGLTKFPVLSMDIDHLEWRGADGTRAAIPLMGGPMPLRDPGGRGVEGKAWDESQHPRAPAGSDEGGQFTEGGGEETTAGERAQTPPMSWEDPPEGYVRLYRGINPERNEIAGEDDTHGLWFTSSLEEAVTYANWDYEGTGELGPKRAVVAVDVPMDDAVEFGRSGSRRAFDPEDIFDPAGIEMIVDRDVADKARLYEGDLDEAALGMPKGWSKKAWDESQHPREPAGSAEGGQFTEGDGGAAVGAEPARHLTSTHEPPPYLTEVGRASAERQLDHHQRDLGHMAAGDVALLRAAGTRIIVSGHETAADLIPRLKGVQPTGWSSGATWDKVGGVYEIESNTVYAGVGRSGAASLVLHETGHALHYSLPQEDWAALQRVWGETVAQDHGVDPYFRQPQGYADAAGPQGHKETFAEAYAELRLGYTYSGQKRGRVSWERYKEAASAVLARVGEQALAHLGDPGREGRA